MAKTEKKNDNDYGSPALVRKQSEKELRRLQAEWTDSRAAGRLGLEG